jgi:hypothetical protein
MLINIVANVFVFGFAAIALFGHVLLLQALLSPEQAD